VDFVTGARPEFCRSENPGIHHTVHHILLMSGGTSGGAFRLVAVALGAAGIWGAWAWARGTSTSGDAGEDKRKSRLRDALVLRGVTLRRCSSDPRPFAV